MKNTVKTILISILLSVGTLFAENAYFGAVFYASGAAEVAARADLFDGSGFEITDIQSPTNGMATVISGIFSTNLVGAVCPVRLYADSIDEIIRFEIDSSIGFSIANIYSLEHCDGVSTSRWNLVSSVPISMTETLSVCEIQISDAPIQYFCVTDVEPPPNIDDSVISPFMCEITAFTCKEPGLVADFYVLDSTATTVPNFDTYSSPIVHRALSPQVSIQAIPYGLLLVKYRRTILHVDFLAFCLLITLLIIHFIYLLMTVRFYSLMVSR